MSFCARCDFQSDDLAEHAADSGHWLCICCAGSLRQDESVTCERCITKAREHLSVIVDCYAMLPDMLGHPVNASSLGVRVSGSDETPLPGGDALILLSNGSGGSQAQGRAHNVDHYPTDAPSVAYELSRWEDDWRQMRGDPGAPGPASVTASAGYLEVHTRWAANTHPAFDEFVADLRKIRAKLEAVTGMARTPLRNPAQVGCFECGERLVREWTDQGFEDDWTCRACHRRYDQASYWLAMRAKLEAKGAG